MKRDNAFMQALTDLYYAFVEWLKSEQFAVMSDAALRRALQIVIRL